MAVLRPKKFRLDLLLTRVSSPKLTRVRKETSPPQKLRFFQPPITPYQSPFTSHVSRSPMSVHVQPKPTSSAQRPDAVPRRSSFFHALRFRESCAAWIFIPPALIGFFTFYLMPAFRALYISLTDWNLLRAPKFIGGANFPKLWNDPA